MVKIVVGMMGSSAASGSKTLATPSQVSDFLTVVKKHNVRELDTARAYMNGKSEELLGAVGASTGQFGFAVATKAPAFTPGSLAYEKIKANCNASLKALGMEKVDIYYLHGPDAETPLAEQCRAIGELYAEGRFERFGISNLTVAQVQEVYDICKTKGYPLPSVYQGAYSPILRLADGRLLPLLRKLGIAFYAYSPLAGGLLAKKLEELEKPTPGSRYDAMKVFGDIYLTDDVKRELKNVQAACDAENISLMEATLRWFMHHSPLSQEDGVILGAASKEQIEQSLRACEKEALPQKVLQAFVEMNDGLKDAIKYPGM